MLNKIYSNARKKRYVINGVKYLFKSESHTNQKDTSCCFVVKLKFHSLGSAE